MTTINGNDAGDDQTFREKMLKHKSVIFIVVSQIIFIIFFGAFADYSPAGKPTILPKKPYVSQIECVW